MDKIKAFCATHIHILNSVVLLKFSTSEVCSRSFHSHGRKCHIISGSSPAWGTRALRGKEAQAIAYGREATFELATQVQLMASTIEGMHADRRARLPEQDLDPDTIGADHKKAMQIAFPHWEQPPADPIALVQQIFTQIIGKADQAVATVAGVKTNSTAYCPKPWQKVTTAVQTCLDQLKDCQDAAEPLYRHDHHLRTIYDPRHRWRRAGTALAIMAAKKHCSLGRTAFKVRVVLQCTMSFLRPPGPKGQYECRPAKPQARKCICNPINGARCHITSYECYKLEWNLPSSRGHKPPVVILGGDIRRARRTQPQAAAATNQRSRPQPPPRPR